MRVDLFQLRRWLNACLILVLTQAGWAQAPVLRTGENRQFEIVALDIRSVNYVDELSRHIVEASTELLDSRGMNFPQRILVRLKPEKFVDFEGPYQVSMREGGFVTLDLLWNDSMNLALCTRGLSEALLLRYSLYHFGPSSAANLRQWTVSALATEALLDLRPALFRIFAGDFPELGATPLDDLLARKWNDPMQERSGYWFLQSLAKLGLQARSVREIFSSAVAGTDVYPVLKDFLRQSERSPESDPDEWWAQILPGMFAAPQTVIEDMASSRQWIARLARFENEVKEMNLKQVWKNRNDPALRQTVEARLELLRIRMPRVNPAYFNAARSLGVLFEVILESERPHEFVGSLGKFLCDFEDTKELENLVAGKLGRR